MSGYGINNFRPGEIYLKGKEVIDLSRLREKPSNAPRDAEISTEDKVSIGSDKNSRNSKEPITLTILHTNDMHGNIEAREVTPEESGHQKTMKSSGQADMGTMIDRERERAKDKGENFLLLDAGDMAMGTSISGMFEGEPMMKIMNSHGYDAAALGNHDFDWGLDGLQEMKKDADFPFLSSNVFDQNGKPLPNIQPFVIKEIPGMKVGIVGVTTQDVTKVATTEEVKNLRVKSQIDVLKKTIPLMKKQGAELIVVLSHSGLKMDKKIAREVKGIDLIIGGHSHDGLDRPLKLGKTMVVQAGHAAHDIGKVKIRWSPKRKKVIKSNARLLTNNADTYKDDKDITSIVKTYRKKHDAIMNTKIGKTEKDLVHLKEEGGETELGNLITDMMRKEVRAEIGMINSGSIRTNISSGDITRGEVYDLIPFPSKIVKVSMKGSDLVNLLDQSAGRESDKILQVAGLQVVYDSTAPQGERIKSAKDHKGNPIEADKEYTIATTDFLAGCGDYYSGFIKGKRIKMKSMPPGLTDTVTKRMKKMDLVSASVQGRLQDIA